MVSPSPLEAMAGGASVVKEPASARGVAGAGPQVVVQPADLGEPLLARRAPGHPPVLADHRGEIRRLERGEAPELVERHLASPAAAPRSIAAR